MIIVSGKIYVRPSTRPDFLQSSAEAVALARCARGCRDFVVAADPLKPTASTSMKNGSPRRHFWLFGARGLIKFVVQHRARRSFQAVVASTGPA